MNFPVKQFCKTFFFVFKFEKFYIRINPLNQISCQPIRVKLHNQWRVLISDPQMYGKSGQKCTSIICIMLPVSKSCSQCLWNKINSGATVYTTVGTVEKQKFLQDRFSQLKDEHFADSHNAFDFEQHIRIQTNGRGVNVVLNSLSEEKLQVDLI